MTWVKLDDGFFRNRKAIAAGQPGRALYVAGLCFCAAGLTDGAISNDAVRIIAADAGVPQRTAAHLVKVGLWRKTTDGYLVPDYLLYNPSREKVLADRDRAKDRQASHRASRRDIPSDIPRSHDRSNGVSSGGPSPTPLVTSTSSVTSSTDPPRRNEILKTACTLIANRRPPRGDNPGAYINAAVKGLLHDHHQAGHKLLTETPTLTATELADLLEPPAPTDFTFGTGPTPTIALADPIPLEERDPIPKRPDNLATLRRTPDDAA